jgi:CBS domain containing-hemolysin-like protein
MSDSASGDRGANNAPADAAEPTLAERILDWLRLLRGQRAEETLREELEELLEEHAGAETPENAEERTLLRNILRVSELRVEDVMVPRADIVAVEEGTPLPDLVRLFGEAQHSRLPVYRDTLDGAIGMIHIKDLLPFWGAAEAPVALPKLLRRLLFVPPSMPVLDLLLQMRASRVHMALVVDEYGGVDGLVTIEDLVEQIVGEIHDEYDEAERPMLAERPDGNLEADARCPVEELERRIGFSLLDPEREEYIDTLGGLVFALVGRVPVRGEVIAHPSGLAFEVVDADSRRLKRLRVRNVAAARGRGQPAP